MTMVENKQSLHHVALASFHYEKTLRLYEEGLGLKPYRTWGRDKRISFFEMSGGSCVEIFEAKEESADGGCWLHVALATTDIKASYERALSAGATPIMEPTFADIVEAEPKPVKMWFAYVRGFEGEQIEFIQEL